MLFNMNQPKYLTVKQITEHYPFTKGQVAYFCLYRHKNGLERCVVKIGKKIYFIREKFEEWIENGGK